MTSAPAAGRARATIERLGVAFLLPREHPEPGVLAGRLEQAAGTSLRSALGEALAGLETVDAGAVWVIRRLPVALAVPAGDPDVERQARRVAAAVADAIVRILRSGPGGDVVRFGGRSEWLATFVAAQLDGAGDAWMFDGLAGLRALTPAAALRSGASSLDVPVAEVAVELAVRARLGRLVAAAAPAEIERLWEACLASSPGGVARRATVSEVIAAAGGTAGVRAAGGPGARALRLLALVAPRLGGRADVLSAVAAAARTAGAAADGPPRAAGPGGGAATRGRPASGSPPSAPRVPGGATSGATSPPEAPLPVPTVLTAPGTPAFLALPSLEAVGFAALTPGDRYDVLRRMLGLPAKPEDPVLSLASGTSPDAPSSAPIGTPAAAVRASLLAALVADERLDGEVSCELVPGACGGRAVALVREGDIRLAAAPVEPGSEPPWEALAAEVSRALGRPAARREDVPGRPASEDLAFLAAADAAALARALVARAGLQHLARRLLGFDRASMRYLVERFLPPGGTVVVDPGALLVELPPPPLHVVLVMAGLDAFSYQVPWLAREVVVTHEEA